MIFVGLVIGFIIGTAFWLSFMLFKKRKEYLSNIPKYTRRGIYNCDYTVTNGSTGIKESVEVQFEIGELESTDSKSKIEILSCISNKSRYNTDKQKNDFIELENKKWIDSNKIDWINTLASERNSKIDSILK